MKSLFSFAFFLCFSLSGWATHPSFVPQISVARASSLTTYVYARVTSAGAYLYDFAQRTVSDNAIFLLPETYFVLLLSNYNDQFYYAQYRDVTGYVLKSDVTPVAETPASPYLESFNFRVFTAEGGSVYDNPSSEKSPFIATVEPLSTVNCYGVMTGEEMIDGRGNLWFFCKTGGKFGYIYAGLCDEISEIVPNTEQMTAIANPFEDDNSFLYSLVEMTPALKILVLFLLVVPSFFLIYLLFKPYKIVKEKPKIKRRSKPQTIKQIQDYYEDSL